VDSFIQAIYTNSTGDFLETEKRAKKSPGEPWTYNS